MEDHAVTVLTSLLLIGLASNVRADIAPPPSYPRTPPCTASDRQDIGEECVECLASLGAVERCGPVLRAYDFALECKGKVSFYRREVWCRPTTGNPKPLPSYVTDFLRDPKATSAAPPTPPAPQIPEAPPLPPPPPDQDGSWHQNCSTTGGSIGIVPALLALSLGLLRRRRS
jgi:uncharacterized protein (TIGR03382 family)